MPSPFDSASVSVLRVRPIVALALALTTAGLLSCDSATEPRAPGHPASLEIVSGHDQEGVVGQELPAPLVVRVEDEAEQPVAGQLVNWVVTSGGGTVFAGSSLTNDEGIAQEWWTLGTSTASPQSLEVRAVDPTTGERFVFARFTARPVADAPVTLRRVSDNPTGPRAGQVVSPSPSVRLFDQYENPVANATVTFAVEAGGGSVAPAAAITDETGLATTTWTTGPQPGATNQVSASFGSLPRFLWTITTLSGPSMELAQDAPLAAQNGVRFTQQPVMRVIDENGQYLASPNLIVTVEIESGSGTLSGTRSVRTDYRGIARFLDLAVSGSSSSYTLKFTASGASGFPQLLSRPIVMNEPVGSARALQFVSRPSPSVRSGEAFTTPPSVQLTDATGAPVRQAGLPVSVSIASGIGTLGGTITIDTDAEGTASFDDLSIHGYSWMYTLSFSAPDLARLHSNEVAMRQPGALTLEKIAGDLQIGSANTDLPNPVVVRLVDYEGAPVPGATIDASTTPSGGTSPVVTDSEGFARLTWRLGQRGLNGMQVWKSGAYPLQFQAVAY